MWNSSPQRSDPGQTLFLSSSSRYGCCIKRGFVRELTILPHSTSHSYKTDSCCVKLKWAHCSGPVSVEESGIWRAFTDSYCSYYLVLPLLLLLPDRPIIELQKMGFSDHMFPFTLLYLCGNLQNRCTHILKMVTRRNIHCFQYNTLFEWSMFVLIHRLCCSSFTRNQTMINGTVKMHDFKEGGELQSSKVWWEFSRCLQFINIGDDYQWTVYTRLQSNNLCIYVQQGVWMRTSADWDVLTLVTHTHRKYCAGVWVCSN